MKDFYIGLDMGTDSVGWAVADEDYNLCKFKGKAMWGVRLFDESATAAERRGFRTARRRAQRKRQRILWLQMLFNEEISKKDIAFFQRLNESKLYLEDKSTNVPYAVFADESFTDVDYHKLYPTIYHLRKELVQSDEPHDVRLVYLALHHLIKNRGHFLFENVGSDFEKESSFEVLFKNLQNYILGEYELALECISPLQIADILKDKSKRKTTKSSEICKLLGISKKGQPRLNAIVLLMCGQSVKLADLYGDENYNKEEKSSISFEKGYEDNEETYRELLLERFELIEKIKALYDWAILADILKGETYISFAKVKTYDEHRHDLQQLKAFVKERCRSDYNEIFRETSDKLNNYTAYCGKFKENGRNGVILHSAYQTDFCKYLKSKFDKLDKSGYEDMFEKIENGSFMPKIVVKDNGVIPMQVNESEVRAILKNASGYLDFLNNQDKDGITVADKILQIFEFRIPYYVGPLNVHSDNSWLVRKDGKIYPWNFNKIVDVDKSAEEFINKLTAKCTYLPDRDVIPKNSILYSRYMVLNELNNLKLDGKKPDVSFKQAVFNDLFMHRRKVTQKALREYIKAQTGAEPEITGIDGDFKANMRPAIELAGYNLSEPDKEEIIKAITIFGDDKKLLKRRIKDKYSEMLSEDEIKKICKLKYKDWGRLSREFLTEIFDVDTATGECKDNIINTLWNTNDNLMELLGAKHNFTQSIEEAVSESTHKASIEKMVEDMYVSPKVKRTVFQSLKIMKEIVKIKGHAPKKVFVEMTRHDGTKGDNGRTKSRKKQLEELYKKCKEDSTELWDELEKTDDDEFRQDKLFLYYTQMGRCMYSGERIELRDLFNKNLYDIDHIFPRSKVKDDSIDNRVLVKKQINSHKDNDYPLDSTVREKMRGHWQYLLQHGFISKKKYDRLTRVTPLTDDELADFIARQLVETSQSTKAVATLLKTLYPTTEIVYVKAGLVSWFRDEYKLFIKCREVNDLHHAKDAYLNIVVGNVYNVRYTHSKAIFIKGLQTKKYSLNRMFAFDTPGAWNIENEKSLSIVKKTVMKNNILYTRYSYMQKGGLFKIQPLKKGNGQAPLKKDLPLSDIGKYGGYDKPTASYFSYIKYEGKKGKECRQLVAIDNYLKKYYEENPIEYLTNRLGFKNPAVLIPVIKYNSCIEIDGFRMSISSKSSGGKAIVYKPAVQLVLGAEKEAYVKKISKVLSKPEEQKITSYDGVSAEENIELFDALTAKMTNTIFKIKLEDIGNKINSGRDKFVTLDVKKQCYVINEILKIMHCNVVTGDLSLIGAAKKAGVVSTSSALSEIKKVSSIMLINQSVTGLFETKIDLLNI